MSGTRPVLARAALWHHECDASGKLQSVTGVFDLDALGMAEGTAKFLRLSGICPDAHAVRGSGCYEIRMNETNANLGRFERWAHEHSLMPDLARQRLEAERADILRHERHKELSRHRFKKAPAEEARAHLARCHCEIVEGPPAGQGGAIVISTSDPETAFHAGQYLSQRKFLDAAYFDRLNQEINLALESGEVQEFRLGISPSMNAAFEEAFPTLMARAAGDWAGRTQPPASGRQQPRR